MIGGKWGRARVIDPHPYLTPLQPYFTQREGFVRMNILKQGLVVLPGATLATESRPTYKYIWIVNSDFGGSVSLVISIVFCIISIHEADTNGIHAFSFFLRSLTTSSGLSCSTRQTC